MYCVVIYDLKTSLVRYKLESWKNFYRKGIKKGDTKKVIALCMFIQTLFFVSRLARNS